MLTDPNQSNWEAAVLNAINAWNNEPNCSIRMTYTAKSPADITIGYQNLSYYDEYGRLVHKYYAVAHFPVSGKPGRTIKVDTYFDYSLDLEGKTWIIMHELGHCLGLRHTDYMNRNNSGENEGDKIIDDGIQYDAIHIMGTPKDNSDTRSLMWSIRSLQRWPEYSFSPNDVIALQNLYPLVTGRLSISPSYSDSYTDGDYRFTDTPYCVRLTGTPIAPITQYEWWGTGITVVSGQGTANPLIQFNRSGPCTVKCTVTIDGRKGELSETTEVYDSPKYRIDRIDMGESGDVYEVEVYYSNIISIEWYLPYGAKITTPYKDLNTITFCVDHDGYSYDYGINCFIKTREKYVNGVVVLRRVLW